MDESDQELNFPAEALDGLPSLYSVGTGEIGAEFIVSLGLPRKVNMNLIDEIKSLFSRLKSLEAKIYDEKNLNSGEEIVIRSLTSTEIKSAFEQLSFPEQISPGTRKFLYKTLQKIAQNAYGQNSTITRVSVPPESIGSRSTGPNSDQWEGYRILRTDRNGEGVNHYIPLYPYEGNRYDFLRPNDSD